MNQKGAIPIIVYIVLGVFLLGGFGGAAIMWWMSSPTASFILLAAGIGIGLVIVPNACRIVAWSKKVWLEIKA